MIKKIISSVVISALSISILASCSQQAVVEMPDFAENVKVEVQAPVDGNQKYLAYEIDFVSDKEYDDPVYTVNMDVIFTNTETGTTLKVPAFWNGGTAWKVRYALTELGIWTWETVCTDETNVGLHGLSGEVKCVDYVGDLDIYKHGFIKAEDGKRYFMYADGTPFYYLADTHFTLPMENIDGINPFCDYERVLITQETADKYGITSMFKYIMDYRAKQGFTVIQSQQLAIYNGVSGNSWLGDAEGTIFTHGVNDMILDKFQELDRYFAYIAEKGLVHTHTQFAYPEELIEIYLAGGISEEAIDILCRYWVARYSAYPVLWATAQEGDNDYYEYNGCTPETNPWKIVLESIAKYDPYDHPSTCHMENVSNTTTENSVFDDLEPYSWYAIQYTPNLENQKTEDINMLKGFYEKSIPVVNYEGSYDHYWAGPTKARAQGWLAYLNGDFGYGYGVQPIWSLFWGGSDSKNANDDEIDTFSLNLNWFEGLYLEGGEQMVYMKNLLTQYEWWNLVPCFDGNEYFRPKKTAVLGYNSGSCMATVNNELYIGYFYSSKSISTVLGTLTGMKNGNYEVYWMDCETGIYWESEIVTVTDGTYDVYKPSTSDCILVARLISE